jgi:hypothetical protein
MSRRSALAVLLVVALFAICFAQTVPFDVGVKVGKKIPAFALPDQKGVARDFASLKGSTGLVLLFFRSADW